jgi:uncharacterized protein (TIGR03000 family)
MYSVILMAALTTSTADAPGFHKRSLGCTGGMYLHSGCYGSCHGGCFGSFGGGWGGGCVGCWGCMGCYGVYSGPVMNPAGNPMMAPPVAPPAGTGTVKPDTGKSAQLIIEKPADATIFVDNLPVKSEGATQTFATPVLDPSQAYYYIVRVEMTRDGKAMSESRRVIVRSGQTIQEMFNEQGIVTASAR